VGGLSRRQRRGEGGGNSPENKKGELGGVRREEGRMLSEGVRQMERALPAVNSLRVDIFLTGLRRDSKKRGWVGQEMG